MQLSTTTKYAIQTLGFMANNPTTKYSSKYLSDILDIPYKYLSKIMTKLAKADLVSSVHGKYGGFFIEKDIKDIRIVDIAAVFEDIDIQQCILVDTQCNEDKRCIVHDQWQKPKCAIDDFFINTTLFQLIEKQSLVKIFN
jgi:Rrf2 family protein